MLPQHPQRSTYSWAPSIEYAGSLNLFLPMKVKSPGPVRDLWPHVGRNEAVPVTYRSLWRAQRSLGDGGPAALAGADVNGGGRPRRVWMSARLSVVLIKTRSPLGLSRRAPSGFGRPDSREPGAC